MPRTSAAPQNHALFGAATATREQTNRPTRLHRTVARPPTRSSISPNRKAPSPAATFNAIPNTMTSAVSMPNVPAA